MFGNMAVECSGTIFNTSQRFRSIRTASGDYFVTVSIYEIPLSIFLMYIFLPNLSDLRLYSKSTAGAIHRLRTPMAQVLRDGSKAFKARPSYCSKDLLENLGHVILRFFGLLGPKEHFSLPFGPSTTAPYPNSSHSPQDPLGWCHQRNVEGMLLLAFKAQLHSHLDLMDSQSDSSLILEPPMTSDRGIAVVRRFDNLTLSVPKA
jgi:hypothetical protein